MAPSTGADQMDLRQVAAMLQQLTPTQRAEVMNAHMVGLDALLGVQFVSVEDAQIEARLAVEARHLQPYGLVHGGVYAALGESICSVGAALSVLAEGMGAVGAENLTRFLRGTRPGQILTAHARPLPERSSAARRVWEATIRDGAGQVCAISRVTVAVLPPGKRIAGEVVALQGGLPTDDDAG